MIFLWKPHSGSAGVEPGTHAWLAMQSGALYPDSPFTVVDAFSLSYRYLPFLVDLFYIFTYFVWWGDFIFRRLLNWVRLLAVKWENKKTYTSTKFRWACLLIFPLVHIACHPGTLAQPTHCKRWWGLSPGWAARGSTLSISIPLATVGVLNKRAMYMLR